MGKLGRSAACAAIAAITGLTLAGTAQANTLTLGTQFQGTIDSAVLDGGAGTIANTFLPAPLIASSPTDGTIISWRFSADTTQWTPQIVRPLGGDQYTRAGAGPSQAGTGTGNIVGPFPLNLPIKKGDLFGVAGGNFKHFGFIHTLGARHAYFAPPLQDGISAAPDFEGASDFEEALSATVRYCLVPKLKGKKPKAAKKALKAADCTFGGKRKSKKHTKKKKVVKQTVAPGTAISDTAPVAIKVSRPKS